MQGISKIMHYTRIVLLLAAGLVLSALADELSAVPTPIPAPPSVSAKAYILQDFYTGRVIAEGNADEPMEPASLTKIMTAYVVFHELREGNISLKDSVTISEKAWRTGGSKMFVEVGKQVSLEDLLQGMIVQSGNDASVALAEHVAGSEEAFASLMNIHAKRLGLTGSHFKNSDGLPHPDHFTTARDIATLTAALIREFPQYYRWHSEKEFTFNGITQHNRNKLLWWDEAVDGVKTGHTQGAGYCLAASAHKDGMRLISVVMGTDSTKMRARETQKLLNYGFRFFETHKIHPKNTPVTQTRVWMGTQAQLSLGLAEDLYITIPRGRYAEVEVPMTVDPKVTAPVDRGQPLGTINVMLEGKKLLSRPLVALHEVAQGAWWQRLLDYVKLLIFDLFN
jgi:D-alanyl-D-alanine carboxypeptidase (penicillin-binding protein 5/6)